MVLKQNLLTILLLCMFENDVEMYGAQTPNNTANAMFKFENDVEMYGAQTNIFLCTWYIEFENDVEMYGAQTHFSFVAQPI